MNKHRSLDSSFGDLNYNDLTFMKYSAVMSVIAEHLFSTYKSLNSNNLKSIKFKNIRKYLIFQFFFSSGKLIS